MKSVDKIAQQRDRLLENLRVAKNTIALKKAAIELAVDKWRKQTATDKTSNTVGGDKKISDDA